jgi:hypothetical protein
MRASLIVVTSVALLLFGPIVLGQLGWSLWAAIAYVFGLLAALQAGCLIGVGLSLPRVTTPDRARLSRDSTQAQQP